MILIDVQHKFPNSNTSINFKIEGELQRFYGVYGHSGAGKSTLLNIICGFITPQKGKIIINDEIWFDATKNINLSPQKRSIGMVFQDYALFPNMSVKENLEYALPKKKDKAVLQDLVELMELESILNQFPPTLSGGQKQRVALARSVVQQPKLLLLDEPLAALDQEMRLRLQDYLQQLHQQYRLTTFLISHDIAEMYKLCQQIIAIDSGKVTAIKSPSEFFQGQKSHGKFQFTAKVLDVIHQDIMHVVSLLIGEEVVRVVVDPELGHTLKSHDTVVVTTKAFQPIIHKIG
ncbi:ATP-binding cassette domain-containing protein [Flammeovirga sp. SubArs3]|uniref:ATP-binding cassette domain-containing protein n=1 Tax=Flammeovirga sp. SubArs3 TaxID=2995316 RepID=UPI00248B63A5|nr:ATP-binding cassette domain-containing protein [Flammeovirga sp. SubArs3]